MFNLCLSCVSLKCPPLLSVSRRILYDHYMMFLFYFISFCIHLVHSAFSYVLLCELLLDILTLKCWYHLIIYLAYCYLVIEWIIWLCVAAIIFFDILDSSKVQRSCLFITYILKDEYRLILGMLMHVKCIHDLCTLPLDIPPYLNHILVIFILFDDYWE
jgi:hypothetical protein